MKRLKPKIILTGFLVIVITSIIPNAILFIIGEGQRPIEFIEPHMVFIGALTIISISITFFNFLLNRIVINRIKHLDQAVEEVMQGNFNITLDTQQDDEISHLFHNFNLMTRSLSQNEYINKEFARNFSHEMKTPLSVILGYSELIQNDAISQKEKDKYIQIIIDETKRLDKLSQNMLMISRIEHLTFIEKNDTFNLSELIRNIVLSLELLWSAKNQTLELDIDDIHITSNKELIYQVIYNLIHNAIHHSNDDQTITITMKNDQPLTFSISNPGTLSNFEQEQIFNLFVKIDKSRTQKSTGLGLTLAKTIMNKLEGDIVVSSIDNVITFTLKFN